jgi:hypothetical protein
VTRLEAGNHVACGVQELELLSGNFPPAHPPERLEERLFGLHALRARHHCRRRGAQAQPVAVQESDVA